MQSLAEARAPCLRRRKVGRVWACPPCTRAVCGLQFGGKLSLDELRVEKGDFYNKIVHWNRHHMNYIEVPELEQQLGDAPFPAASAHRTVF